MKNDYVVKRREDKRNAELAHADIARAEQRETDYAHIDSNATKWRYNPNSNSLQLPR